MGESVHTDAGAHLSAATDHSLLRRYRSGSEHAASELYVRYVHRLRELIRSRVSQELASRVDTDDVVQSVFGSFFRRLDKNLYDVPPGGELWNLFLVMALNKIRNLAAHHRADKRDVRRSQELSWSGALTDATDDRQAAAGLLKLVIDETLEGLPDAHRRIVEMRMEGFEVAEIAQATQRSRRTVERLLQQIRGRLQHLRDESV